MLAAFAGGVLAQRIGLPVVVGYLVAGVAIGPFTGGFTVDPHSIDLLAEIGVAFLMFAVGAEFSRRELRRMARIAILGGGLQILATTALGLALGRAFGASLLQSVFLGALLSLSSTVVVLKVLMARGELQSLHGRVALGILIAQDLAVIPMVVVLPALGGAGGDTATRLLIAAGEAFGLGLAAYLLGARIVPWVLGHIAVTRTRELFLLGVVGLALGVALAAQAIGLSLAFGAFLAGLVVAESEYRTQVVAEVLPLRDLFTSLFFVSVGMLVNPLTLVAHAPAVALLTLATVVGKFAIVTAVVLLLGLPGRVAVLAGLSLAQVGEFSFVLARVGVSSQTIPSLFFDLMLATALTTVILTPLTLRAAPAVSWVMARVPGLRERFRQPLAGDERAAELHRHAVICGCGRVGQELLTVLVRRKLPHLVIEYNPDVVQDVRSAATPVLYGDAANAAVLHHASLGSARLLAALVPDPTDAENIVRQARAINPRLDIVARASDAEQVERLRRAGATEVVQPEFEAGVEVIRHALQRYGVAGAELNIAVAGRRRSFYGPPTG